MCACISTRMATRSVSTSRRANRRRALIAHVVRRQPFLVTEADTSDVGRGDPAEADVAAAHQAATVLGFVLLDHTFLGRLGQGLPAIGVEIVAAVVFGLALAAGNGIVGHDWLLFTTNRNLTLLRSDHRPCLQRVRDCIAGPAVHGYLTPVAHRAAGNGWTTYSLRRKIEEACLWLLP